MIESNSNVKLEDPRVQQPNREDKVFTILFTSGSSSSPKGVMFSADVWRRDIDGDG